MRKYEPKVTRIRDRGIGRRNPPRGSIWQTRCWSFFKHELTEDSWAKGLKTLRRLRRSGSWWALPQCEATEIRNWCTWPPLPPKIDLKFEESTIEGGNKHTSLATATPKKLFVHPRPRSAHTLVIHNEWNSSLAPSRHWVRNWLGLVLE